MSSPELSVRSLLVSLTLARLYQTYSTLALKMPISIKRVDSIEVGAQSRDATRVWNAESRSDYESSVGHVITDRAMVQGHVMMSENICAKDMSHVTPVSARTVRSR